MPTRERSIMLHRAGFEDVDDAMGWAVRMLDRELKGATMVRLTVEQVQVIQVGSDDEHYEWQASVTGMIEEDEPDPWAA
jgi:threonyl-tRNA synthetase